jgi:polysaccharide biosynthesis transport protein
MKAFFEVFPVEDQEQTIDIRHYLQVIYKKRYLFIAVAAGIITAITVASYFMPKIYEASTTVSIERNYLNVLMRDIAVAPSMEDQLKALSIVMTSRSNLLHVLTDLGVPMDTKTETETEKLFKHFQKKTLIKFGSSRGGTDLFTVTYQDHDPKFARDYVNALVKQYVLGSLSAKREESLGANRFIFEQIELYKRKINEVEAKLEQKKKQPGVLAAMRLVALEKKYHDLLTQYTERHPEVMRLKAEIESAREQAREQKSSGPEDGGADRSAEKAQGTASGSRKSIADLERDRDAYKKVYDSLAASLGRSEVSAQVEVQAKADMFNILEPAVLPLMPVSRPRWLVIMLGIVAGIAGAAGTVILLDMMDRTIKSIDTFRKIGLPVIGVIPRITSVEAIVAAKRKDMLAYGFAGLYLVVVGAIVIVEYVAYVR